jgi:hypothetical protein
MLTKELIATIRRGLLEERARRKREGKKPKEQPATNQRSPSAKTEPKSEEKGNEKSSSKPEEPKKKKLKQVPQLKGVSQEPL